jgi:hypothetical protein
MNHCAMQPHYFLNLVFGNQAIDVVQRTNALGKIDRQFLQHALGRVKHEPMNAGKDIVGHHLGGGILGLEPLPGFEARPLHHASLVQVEALFDDVELHEGEVALLLVLCNDNKQRQQRLTYYY